LEVSDEKTILYKVGTEQDCTPSKTFCNGPLQVGVQYR